MIVTENDPSVADETESLIRFDVMQYFLYAFTISTGYPTYPETVLEDLHYR